MTLYDPVALPRLTPEEFDQTARTRPTGFGEYLSSKVSLGFDYSLFGRALQASQDIESGFDRFGPLPKDMSLEDARARGFNVDQPRLTEEQWKKAGLAREGLAYEGGTLDHERSRTEEFDRRRYRDSVIARYQGNTLAYAAGFGAQVLGGGLSPENFIPWVGPAVKTAMVTRLGVIGSHTAVGAIDNVIGTALVDAVALPDLARRGENVGAADFAMDLVLGAVAGTVLGSAGGWFERRRAASNAIRTPGVVPMADALDAASEALDTGTPVDAGGYIRNTDAVQRLQRMAPELVGGPGLNGIRAGVPIETPSLSPVRGAPPHRVTGTELDAGTTIRVYHGSPHRFERFSMEHIGKGEGAQAFGHGLYFAESEGVAKSYSEMFNPQIVSANNKRMGELAREMSKLEKPGQYRQYSDPKGYELAAEYDRLMDEKLSRDKGHLYAVDLHVGRDELLDWDKPLSEQPQKVRAALAPLIAEVTKGRSHIAAQIAADEKTAGEIYRYVSDIKNRMSQQDASAALRAAGIRGIQYLDAGSRAGAEGTRNIVMFDEAAIRIREINGRPIDLTTTATEYPPEPSVVAAEKSYKVVPPDFTAEQAARIKQDGLDAESHAADQKMINQARKQEELTAADEAELAAGELAAKAHDDEALTYEALQYCAGRYA